ncbi:helix-turn-helix domain-containing protein [Streptomyces diastaticus]|uniref:helix-turn-helix domain-containing protein n=1 Tax=Streptomyces diastaticus TaxID=1956 RepID=UPI00364DD601
MTTDDEHDQDQDPGTAPRAPGPGLGQVFTQAQAAAACGVGRTTIRRWRQAGQLPGAYETPEGTWKIPLADLLAHGAQVGTPAPPAPAPAPEEVAEAPAPAPASEEVARLRAELERVRAELVDAEHRAEVADTMAAGLQDLLQERAERIRDLRQSLAALMPAPDRASLDPGPTAPVPPAATPPPSVPGQQSGDGRQEAEEDGGRWWKRRRR